MTEQKCKNECGNSWCCSHWVMICSETDTDTITLAKLRGMKVYKPHPIRKANGVFIVMDSKCDSLCKKCTIYKDRPDVCKNFPSNTEAGILPDKCPFSSPYLVKFGECERI